jgi:hypothetical protein
MVISAFVENSAHSENMSSAFSQKPPFQQMLKQAERLKELANDRSAASHVVPTLLTRCRRSLDLALASSARQRSMATDDKRGMG